MNRKITFAGDEWDPEDHADGYTEWEEVKSKPVLDYDGFYTDYTMWYNEFEDKYVFTFGDKDIYYPENADWDWECENRSEADEWFDDYVGPGEEDEDIYSSSKINSSASAEEISTPVTLRVEYYPYERYTDSGQKKARVSGRDLLEALKKMISHMGLYITPDFIEDEGLSAEEVLQSIINSNGDGCDFISYLENETTGDVYIDEDYVDEEDWD